MSENGIYEGIPHGNVKLAYSEIFLMLNLIYSEFSCGQCSKCDCGVPACEPTRGILDKQRVLPKKELRLLTNLRLWDPSTNQHKTAPSFHPDAHFLLL